MMVAYHTLLNAENVKEINLFSIIYDSAVSMLFPFLKSALDLKYFLCWGNNSIFLVFSFADLLYNLAFLLDIMLVFIFPLWPAPNRSKFYHLSTWGVSFLLYGLSYMEINGVCSV